MSCCCIASSSRMTHPKFITSAATRSFRLLFNICSMGLHGKSTSSRSLLTAGGGTTRNVADRSVQHRKLFVIGWKQLLFAVANTKVRWPTPRYRHMREAQSRRLVLGNIHVLYFPGRGDVKLGQVRSGSRELGGSVDLLDHYKLGKHLNFFCKRSLPPSISGTQYLRNVVGDTEIKKGEGMELNQLSKNSSYVRHQRVHLHPFGLDLLTDAFQLGEATSADHLLEGIVLPSGAPNLKNEYKEKKQHKKIKHRDGLRKQDPSSCIDKDHMLNRDNDKEKNGSTELWSRFFPETASKEIG